MDHEPHSAFANFDAKTGDVPEQDEAPLAAAKSSDSVLSAYGPSMMLVAAGLLIAALLLAAL